MTSTQRATRSSHWLILSLFGAVMAVGGTDMTKVTVALPVIADDLELSALQLLWTADIYALAAGVTVVPAAVLADRFGRKRLYLFGLGIALVSAAVAGSTPNPEVLLLARVGQGVGTAMLIAGTVAIIRVTFVGLRQRALAYGIWTVGFSVGSALGPLLGGSLAELGQWRWVFWINVPILTVCLVAASLVLRESRNPDPPTLDLRSALAAAGAVGLLILGLKGFAQPTTPAGLSAAAIIGGLIAAGFFVARQLRMLRPFLDVKLFRNALLATSAVVIAATNGLFNGVLYLLTQQFQVVGDLTAIEAGITLIPFAAASAVGGLVGPALQRRFSMQQVIVAGMALTSTGALLLAGPAPARVAMVVLGLGAGIIMAIAANALMSAAPAHRVADAGAIQESAFAIGAGSGIAMLGAVSIHLGGQGALDPTPAMIFGPGADAAISLGAYAYTAVAIGAALVLFKTRQRTTVWT